MSTVSDSAAGPLIRPFTGFVPAPEFGHRIVGPPAPLLTPEQRRRAKLDPLSFRHAVGRGAGSSHAEAAQWLSSCEERSAVIPVGPVVIVYRQARDDLVATGIIADLLLEAYTSGHVKPHEATIAKTQEKMAKYMRKTRIYGNPVVVTHRPHAGVESFIASTTERPSDVSFVSADGFSHAMWFVEGERAEDLCRTFTETLYITDGHHRLAAASDVAQREAQPDAVVPVGLFATSELRLATFARCVVEPELDVVTAVDQLRRTHNLVEVSPVEARPTGRHEFGVRVGTHSYRLRVETSDVPEDVYASLDVNLLQDLVLGPLFGIDDPRTDRRLHFSPDLPSFREEHAGCTAWFLPFPVSVRDVMAIADAGLTMPPKSTRFGPKLPSGLVIRLLERRRR